MDWERSVITYAVAESVLLLNFMSITKHKQQRTITELSIITLRVCITKGTSGTPPKWSWTLIEVFERF